MTDKEKIMTDKEIIKVLEYCTTDGYCMICPYNNCTDKDINELALDLINRQQAEIEKLEKILNGQDQLINALNKCYEQAKSEAIKEFVRKLKCGVPQETGVIHCADVDKLVKEMVGENNA